jgi:hypothetical protein
MGGLLFVSQTILDTWATQGKIEFAGSVMTTVAGAAAARSYRLVPAVRFLELLGADRDPHGLLHRVKAEALLREQGAEVLGDSVVLGDVAYRVEPGFLAEAGALRAAAGSPAGRAPAIARAPLEPPAAGPGEPSDTKRREAEELARFLLENLS